MKKIFYRNVKVKKATLTPDIVGGKMRFEAKINVIFYKSFIHSPAVINDLRVGPFLSYGM